MRLKCLFGHHWVGCKCSACGEVRDQNHDWSRNCEKCGLCGVVRSNRHNWSNDCEVCSGCGFNRANQHDWSKDCEVCTRCAKIRSGAHQMTRGGCVVCGKKVIIGWLRTTALSCMPKEEAWRPYPGHSFGLLLMKLPIDKIIEINESILSVSLTGGRTVIPFGIAIALDEGFRGEPGQKVPQVICTERAKIKQDSGDCFAYVFDLCGDDTPTSTTFRGYNYELEPELTAGALGLGGPPRGSIQAISKVDLMMGVPYGYRAVATGSRKGFMSAPQKHGIILIENWQDNSIVLLTARENVLQVMSNREIRAMLRDGTMVESLGVVIDLKEGEFPTNYGCLSKCYRVTTDSKQLMGGGTLMYLYDYYSQLTILSRFESKVAVMFPGSVRSDTLARVDLCGSAYELVDPVVEVILQ